MRALPQDIDVEAVMAIGRYLDDHGSGRPVSIHGALSSLRHRLESQLSDASLEELAYLNRRFGVELAVADRNREAAERLQVAIDQYRAIGDVTHAAGVTARISVQVPLPRLADSAYFRA